MAVRVHGEGLRIITRGDLAQDLQGLGIEHGDRVFLPERDVDLRAVGGETDPARVFADRNGGLDREGAAVDHGDRIAALVGDEHPVGRLGPHRTGCQGQDQQELISHAVIPSHFPSEFVKTCCARDLALRVVPWLATVFTNCHCDVAQSTGPRLSRSVGSTTPLTGASPTMRGPSTIKSIWRNCPFFRKLMVTPFWPSKARAVLR